MESNQQHCPKCSQKLRWPTDRGKLTISCPRCRHSFTFKPPNEHEANGQKEEVQPASSPPTMRPSTKSSFDPTVALGCLEGCAKLCAVFVVFGFLLALLGPIGLILALIALGIWAIALSS